MSAMLYIYAIDLKKPRESGIANKQACYWESV